MINIEDEINKLLKRKHSLIEAAEAISMKHNIEIETIGAIIAKNSSMKTIAFNEASELNLLKEKKNKFPEGI